MIARASAARPSRLAPIVIVTLAIFGAVALFGVSFGFRLYNIPSGSEIPTLLVGDVVVASKWPYGFSRFSFPIDLGFRGRLLGHAPQRGDNVIFKLPRDNRTDYYVKRVIGLPGDTVQMKQGRLYINGSIVPREPIEKVKAEAFNGTTTLVPTYRETLPNGVSHAIIEVQGDAGFNDNTEEYKVPPGNYFMLGDNRDNSLDSRTPPDQGGVGYVPFDNLVARVEVVLYNFGISDRTLKPVP